MKRHYISLLLLIALLAMGLTTWFSGPNLIAQYLRRTIPPQQITQLRSVYYEEIEFRRDANKKRRTEAIHLWFQVRFYELDSGCEGRSTLENWQNIWRYLSLRDQVPAYAHFPE